MSNCCIIVAGGNGLRMETAVPKQFLEIRGIPILMHTIFKFYQFDPSIRLIIVVPENEMNRWIELCTSHNFNLPFQLVAGGNKRFQSVKNGLAHAGDSNLIAIHDGVRPLVSIETIQRCFDCAEKFGSAIPVIQTSESMREGTLEHSIPVDRSKYYLVQTPQVFKSSIIKQAYEKNIYNPFFTDDASVVEYTGEKVTLVNGNRENIKITFPIDLQVADLFL